MGKRVFPPLPTRPQLMAVYPALFQSYISISSMIPFAVASLRLSHFFSRSVCWLVRCMVTFVEHKPVIAPLLLAVPACICGPHQHYLFPITLHLSVYFVCDSMSLVSVEQLSKMCSQLRTCNCLRGFVRLSSRRFVMLLLFFF